jgi:hypothetical protein
MKKNLLSKFAVLVWLIFTTSFAFSTHNHITGHVFHDENADSIYNGTDTGLAGVKLLLHKDVNNNDILDAGDVLLQESYTLVGGIYIFLFEYDADHQELLVTVDTTSLLDSFVSMGPITKAYSFSKSSTCTEDADFGFTFGKCLRYGGNVVYYKKGQPECKPCQGGLYKLVIRLSDPSITQKVKIDIKVGSTIEYTDSLEPGGLMIVMNSDSSKLPKELDFYINGSFSGSLHTSCSQPVGPGVDFGSFEIFRAYSTNFSPICPPENGDCKECSGGMTEITFQYNGPLSSPKIKITDKNGTLYDDYVSQGGLFTINGPNGGRMGNEISIFIYNNCYHTKLHTSCSDPIWAGMAVGDLLLVSGKSTKGGYLCTKDEPTGGDCGSCDKEIKSLTLKYIGSKSNPHITIRKGKKKYYNQKVTTNQAFTINPSGKDKKLGKDLYFYVNYKKQGKYKFDCSAPMTEGSKFGDFEVVSATTKGDKLICESDDTPSSGCDECKGGVTYIQFKYIGTDAQVNFKITGGSTTYFSGTVSLNGLITIGSKTGSKLEKDVYIYMNGAFHSKIHTSCSKPIGPGVTAGTLVIEESHSTDNGEICGVPPTSGCIDCTEGLKSVTLRYDGTGTNVSIVVKEGKDKVFEGTVNNGSVFSFDAHNHSNFKHDIKIKEGKDQLAIFAADCDENIGAGQVSGDFTLISGIQKNGNILCDFDVKDCGECSGGLSSLSVRYEGTSTKTVKIVGKSIVYFEGSVAPGTIITVVKGSSDSRIVNQLELYINGDHNTSIHTSCSQPIYPGLTFGSFLVTQAISTKAGPICPKEPFCFEPDSTNLTYILGEPDDLGTLLTGGAEIIIDLFDTLLQAKNYTIRASLEGSSAGAATLDIYESLNGISYSSVKHITVSSTTYTDFTLTTSAKMRYLVIQNPESGVCVNVDAIIYNCDAVPVEMLSFDGFIETVTTSKLFWETSLEVDNEMFIIERRFEHEDAFKEVGTVDGVGNSTAINAYDFTDNISGYLQGSIYYRLKQVDFSGKYEYSDILVLGLLNKNEVVVAPNPGIRSTMVVYPQNRSYKNYDISIFSLDGQEITQQVTQIADDHIVELNFGSMAGGFYFVRIQNGEKVTVKKILIK